MFLCSLIQHAVPRLGSTRPDSLKSLQEIKEVEYGSSCSVTMSADVPSLHVCVHACGAKQREQLYEDGVAVLEAANYLCWCSRVLYDYLRLQRADVS